MKQITALGPKKNGIKEITDVKPTDDQILIKNKYVGVCMSEHYDWSTAKEGHIFGHEPMGYVAEVGKNVTGFKVGDRVSGSWGGGMSEFAVGDPAREIIVKIPDAIRDEDAILEPLACMMSAVSKAKVNMPGTPVCVVGAGYMGCGMISLLKLRGAYVVAVDIRTESLENAKIYGADEVYLADSAREKFICKDDPMRPTGFDVVMDWAESSESLDLAINLTNVCGQLGVGAYHTGGKRLVDMQQLNFKAIECLSIHPREVHLLDIGARNAVKLLASGRWDYLNLPVKVYPMNKFDQAHAELETKYGKYMKAVIDMTMSDGEPFIL